MLFSTAVLCATVSIPSAKPETIHKSEFANLERIFPNVFLQF